MDEISIEKQKFIMRVGGEMKDILFRSLVTEFKDKEEMKEVFFNFIPNFVCNIMADSSDEESVEANINAVIDMMKEWMHPDENNDKSVRVAVTYNQENDDLKTEGIH